MHFKFAIESNKIEILFNVIILLTSVKIINATSSLFTYFSR